MWQLLVAQAVGQGVSATMTEKANTKLSNLQKQMYERNVKTVRDNMNLQLEAMAEDFTYQMQMMARDYTQGMATLDREVRSTASQINIGGVQSGIATPQSSFAQDMKNKLQSDYRDASVIHGAVQKENIKNLSDMNVRSRINLIKQTTQQVIDGRYNLASSLGSIAQSTQNAYSQAGLSVASAGISYGMDYAKASRTPQQGTGGTLNPDNKLTLKGSEAYAPEPFKPNNYSTMGGALTWN